MKDVIARLKASKEESEKESDLRARKAGRDWASSGAQADQLGRLEEWTESVEGPWTWQDWLRDPNDRNQAFGADHRLAESILGEELDRSEGDEFWEMMHDGNWRSRDEDRQSGTFLVGFVTGALEVWSEVKDQI